MFTWEKSGSIFNPVLSGTGHWMEQQAQNPFVVDMEDFIRIYFNCRSKKDGTGNSKSYGGFIDIDRNNFFNILNISKKPVLELGSKGEFDEFGVMTGSVIKVGNEHYLYYCGWSRMVSVPYNWAIGLAKSTDGGTTFNRIFKGPVLGPTYNEPYLQAGCSSLFKIGNVFHLWYTSGIKWITTDTKAESVYQIMYATSVDGINWIRSGLPIIAPLLENEAQASPTVINIDNRWHMFFSYRHSTNFRNKERGYRLGYAWSDDLKNWHRNDSQCGLDVSDSGWDSEMICYPHITRIDGKIYLFYCGNNFGEEGFGYARLKTKD